MNATPTIIPGLRSPYSMVGGLHVFGRMLDKIRLHAAGKLPAAWVEAMGLERGFDGRMCRFLGVEYAEIRNRTLQDGDDEEILQWAFDQGREPSAEEMEVWNAFTRKMGWRDGFSERVVFRLEEAGWPAGAVETMFDFLDLDEGRAPGHL